MAGERRAKAKRKKQKRPRRSFWKRRLLTALDLPAETEPTVPKLTAVGRSDLLVENHMGVLQYDSAGIRLLTHEGVLEIQGEKLELSELAAGRAYVRGKLALIRFTT